MTGAEHRSAIDYALSHSRDIDIIQGVKSAVVSELQTLDPTLEIDVTDYFNHSYVPDLVVNWREAGREEQRKIYLRYTLRAATLGGDVRELSEFGPMFLALKDDGDESARASVLQDVADSSRTLVTDVPALDEAAVVGQEPATISPLLSLVRNNIVRGGRGLLEVATVDALAAAATPGKSQEHSEENMDRFSELVDELFVSDAATRLRRASGLIRLALNGDPGSVLDAERFSNVVGGSLSDSELRVLLPYLLGDVGARTSREFWQYVGEMMDLERLESLWVDLAEVDLTPLVSVNLDRWFGLRSSLVMQADELQLEGPPVEPPVPDSSDVTAVTPDDESPQEISAKGPREEELASDRTGGRYTVPARTPRTSLPHHAAPARIPGWRMLGGILCLDIGNWRVQVASNGKRLRGRSDSASALWDDVRVAFENFDLAAVTLMGMTRKIEVASDRDADIRADVATISENLDDTFYVPRASIWSSGESSAVAVEVDFQRMLAMAPKRVALADLFDLAVRLLGYRYPVDQAELATFTAGRFIEAGDQRRRGDA